MIRSEQEEQDQTRQLLGGKGVGAPERERQALRDRIWAALGPDTAGWRKLIDDLMGGLSDAQLDALVNRYGLEVTEYDVLWTIPLTADSPEEAARLARETQLDPDSLATHFEVRRHNEQQPVWYVNTSHPDA